MNSAIEALGRYGLTGSTLTPLAGGTINRVWRLDGHGASFVLKEYRADFPEAARVGQSVAVQSALHQRGLPVPAVIPNLSGSPTTPIAGNVFVLSEYIRGRLYEPGAIPARAARKMGEALARLHDALEDFPPGDTPELPSLDAIKDQLHALLSVARSRHGDPVDEIAKLALEARLKLLATIESVPVCESQWTHGDYEWRNVLFEGDEVAGIIDFDNVIYYPAERDVMRCIALSFPGLPPEVDDFFAGYAEGRNVKPGNVHRYVELYRYFSTFRVWPMSERYLHPERYQPGWDDMIRPFLGWDWDALTERLVLVVDRTAS